MTDPAPPTPPTTIQTFIDQIQALDPTTLPSPDLSDLTPDEGRNAFLVNLFLALDEKLDDIPDSYFAGLSPTQISRCNNIVTDLTNNGPRSAFLKCWSYLDNPGGQPTYAGPEVLCIDHMITLLWWTTFLCTTMPACIWKFLSVDTNWFNFGGCVPDGTEYEDDDPCECREVGIPLEVLMLLITIAAIWCGGPAVSAAGMALLRRIALRTAAAGIG